MVSFKSCKFFYRSSFILAATAYWLSLFTSLFCGLIEFFKLAVVTLLYTSGFKAFRVVPLLKNYTWSSSLKEELLYEEEKEDYKLSEEPEIL